MKISKNNNASVRKSVVPRREDNTDEDSFNLILDQLEKAFRRGHYQEVVDKGSLYIKQSPQAFLFWSLLGRANLKLDKPLSAESCFDVALSLNPNCATTHNWLGVALHSQSKLQQATEHYIKAILLEPKFVLAFYNLGNAEREQGFYAKSIKTYSHVIAMEKAHVDAYNNMGNAYKALGNKEKAIKCYLKAIELRPNYAGVYYNLGNVYKNQGCYKKAELSYKKAIFLNPSFAEARHMLGAVTGVKSNAAPKDYVKSLFNSYAPTFESSLTKNLGYAIPQTLTKLILKNSKDKALGSILDLGCGTGLVGSEIKKFCKTLEGVDLSSSMLNHAKKKNIYHKLSCTDILTYLNVKSLNFDYFVAADVLVYFGELDEIFRLIRVKNQRKAKFVFSTEHKVQDNFFLERSGRYSHSKTYIDALCETFDFKLSYFEKVKLRKDRGKFIDGAIYLLDF